MRRMEKVTGRSDDMIILRGVNLFPTQIEEVLLATEWCGGHFILELTREGRILTLELQIEDRPGMLARVATIIGEAGGNILEVSHNRMLAGTPAKSTTLSLVIEARDAAHAQDIRHQLVEGGFPILDR